MSSDTRIEIKNLSKSFPIIRHPFDIIKFLLSSKKRPYKQHFKALKNISFSIDSGESIGIVGKNGSGKSTLLQILTGILTCTEGTITTRGKIVALLELGAGFKPEFTGIENIYLYGSLLGVSNDEIDRSLNHVIEFADIGEHINLPVKTYSSGMYVRLAFAVTTLVNPDILIIDEALSVGDARFRNKCFHRLRELKKVGVTIIIVSHHHEQIIEHCDRAILLNKGEILNIGAPKVIIQEYMDLLFSHRHLNSIPDLIKSASDKLVVAEDLCKKHPAYNKYEKRLGNRKAIINNFSLSTDEMSLSTTIYDRKRTYLKIDIIINEAVNFPLVSVILKNVKGITLSGMTSHLRSRDKKLQPFAKGTKKTVVFSFVNYLTAKSEYFISVGVWDESMKDKIPVDVRQDLICISSHCEGNALGCINMEWEIAINANEEDENDLVVLS